MALHLREGVRYIVKRFHAFSTEIFRAGERLELLKIVECVGERFCYTEFHFRDLETGRPRLWVINTVQTEESGQDLFDEEKGSPSG